MTKYQQFLNSLSIISEEEFNKIIETLPDFDMDNVIFDSCDLSNGNEIAYQIIDGILTNWASVYSEDVDLENKSFYIYDVETLEDLEEIAKTFKGWTIKNYSHEKEKLIEIIKSENDEEEKEEILNKLSELSLEELRKLSCQVEEKS